MKVVSAVIVIAVIEFMSWPSRAQTTSEMSAWCSAFDNVSAEAGANITIPSTFNSGICWGAFVTAQQYSLIREKNAPFPLLHACVPAAASRLELIHTFRRYAQRHAEKKDQEFYRTQMESFWEAYPCK